jgi:ATP-dependent helicase HrpB
MDEIQRSELALLPWTRALSSLRERAGFLYSTGRFQSLPDLSDRALKTHIKVWLRPFLTGIFSLKQLAQMDLGSAFLSLLSWEQRQIIEKEAPTHIRVPSGSKKPLRYSSEQGLLDSPVLEVRLQEMFGLTRTPKIAGQTIPVTLHLLSPAGRPVQITQDLESFWNTTYAEVKKDLMGRYPKHFWPDDPLGATPTNRAKPRPRPHT